MKNNDWLPKPMAPMTATGFPPRLRAASPQTKAIGPRITPSPGMIDIAAMR